MASALLYYLIILPLSWLPYPVLYLFSDFFFVVMFYVVGYRKKVVFDNLRKSFPKKSEKEIYGIARKFYRHFCDLVVESLKNFSISNEQAQARMVQVDTKVMNRFAQEGKRVILSGGHYSNWELWAVAAAPGLDHVLMAIYKRLNNKFFDAKMRSSRGKYGLQLLPTDEVAEYFRKPESEKPEAVIFAIDQSPSNPKKAVWVKFLGRDTAALFGTEKYATELDLPVFYGRMEKVKRGYYRISYELVEEHPAKLAKGELTQKLHDLLEQDIQRRPELWLWSHRRWKHRPEDSAK